MPADFLASVGQAVLTPSQVSARSHSPGAARQAAPAALMASAGQGALVPVQFSAASHRSTAARQTVLEGRKALAGQVVLVPVQVSAASQGPAAARHTVPALPAGCVQVVLVPLQMSRVQTLPSSVHAVPFVLKASVGQVVLVPVQLPARSHSPAAARHTVPPFPAGCVQVLVLPSHRSRVHGLVSAVHAVPADCLASAGQVVLVPVQLSATSHSPAAARHTAPAFPAGCVHVGAPTVPLHTSAVHTLPSPVQLVPAAFTVSGGQLVLWGASAMSWPMVAVFPVDAFEPVAPAVACATSALSKAASLVPFELSAWNRSVMPAGAPIAEPSLRLKQATSMVLATVVVIDGVELLTCPPDTLMGLVVSTLEYALIPPATREDETVKAYGPGSAAAVPATFQYVDTARFWPLLVVLTINVQPAGGVIVGTLELPCAVIDATMTSLATVAAGLLIASDVALPALPLLALVAPRNPMLVAPGQVSATSHSFAAARHTVPAFPAGCVHVALVPLHTSVVQGSPSSVQAVPLGWKASVGQLVLVPVQLSATSHSPATARHSAPAFPAGCVQGLVLPSHWSRVQGLVSGVQAVPLGCLASVGQVVLVPVQLSATSHSAAAGRDTARAFRAGCEHVALEPLQTSVVHALPSSVQPVPLAFKASAGQAVLVPVQVSARSHSPAAARQTVPAALRASAGQVALVPVQFSVASHRSTVARQTVLDDRKPSAGQVLLVPVQVSAASQGPAVARQTVPAFPAGCVQVALVPSHTSRVQGLPSSVQAVPAALTASAGHVALEPVQVSATSHSFAAARQRTSAV